MLPSSSHRAPGSCAPPAAAGGSGVEPAAPLLDAVLGFDGAHGPGGRAHHDRFGDHVGGVVAHAAQQVAVGDAGGGEVAVVGGDQIIGGQHALQIVAGVDGLLSFLVVLGGEPALEHAAGGLDGAGGDDALGGRSEEHTSELQSRGHLVCRLLLEKKKKRKNKSENKQGKETKDNLANT